MMQDPGFPAAHTTTTTVTQSQTRVTTSMYFDAAYVKTVPGILKVACIVLNLLGFICAISSDYSYHSRATWFQFVSMGGFWITLILVVFYLFHVVEKFYQIPWLMIECVYCGLWTFFYLIAASLAAAWGGISGALGAASFFGFLAMVVYGYDTFIKFVGWRSGDIAQGERVMQMSSTTSAGGPGLGSPTTTY